jgi:phage terminase large subunit
MPKIKFDLSGVRKRVNPYYWPLMWDKHRFLVMRGGAGSGKSVFAAQKFLVRLMREYDARHKFAILRKVMSTHRHSTFALLHGLIHEWGWGDHFTISKSNLEITCNPTGGQLIFLGLDDVQKLKSITGITGVWVEEATEISEADLEQINLRIRGYTRYYKQITLSFNPISAHHFLKRRFYDTPQHGQTRTVLTTYRDNLFLDAEYKRVLEGLKDRDHQLWRIYARGLWGVLKGLIFTPWPVLNEFPEPESTYYGLDFGFNDPMALIRVGDRDSAHYLTELVYERNMTTDDLIARLPLLGVSQSDPIYADAAEPDRIETIRRAGYNCQPAHKGQGSIAAGISHLKASKVYSRPENANLTAELNTYKWAEDKDGRLLDKPVDYRNHAIDAVRYAITTHAMRGGMNIQSGVLEGIGIY